MDSYVCSVCGERHEGPAHSVGFQYPDYYFSIPLEERSHRCVFNSDAGVVDGEHYFIRGCIELPIHGEDQPFIWGVWVTQSEASFHKFMAIWDEPDAEPPSTFGWLANAMPGYPETAELKTMAHGRKGKLRPWIEVEPTDHPLAVEQREGITVARADELEHLVISRLHPKN
jgi:hypothetical protein